MSESENPYEVTSVAAAENDDGLPADTEFLFTNRYIVGTSTIRLPRVCIHTGRRRELQKHESTIYYSHRWLKSAILITCVLFILFGIPAVIGAIFRRPSATMSGLSRSELTGAIAGAAMLLFYVTLLSMGYLWRQEVYVTWYMNAEFLRRARKRSYLQIGFTLCLFPLLFYIPTVWGIPRNGPAILHTIAFTNIIFMFGGVILFQVMRLRVLGHSIRVAGKVEDLYALKGIKPACLAEIRKMVEAANAVPLPKS